MMKRLLGVIPVVFGVVFLTFLLVHAVPGDPVEVMLGESASNADRIQLQSDLGLDQPIYVQFGVYLNKLVHGDWGVSIHSKKPIIDLLAERLPATAKLALLALLFAVLIGLPLGIIAALKVNQWPDKLANLLSLSISAMPHFWMGPMLMMLFALWLGLLPVSGMENGTSIILPALTLGFGLAAILTRMTRASMLEVLHEDFIRTARAKGLAESTVILRHALRAALLPIVTVLGLQLGSLLAGTVITETVFSWDGIGRLLVESIEKRDYPVTQACVLVVALVYVLVNLATDMIYTKIDPRVRFAT
ncbi:nickel ABC transporter permease [Candidatus Methylopumilus turicensis]|uniref:Putative peptide transporter permease subunit: membrane component of ABC superfamily n=1 Tax=Candidatus Methylopumilus turicensis TaxID=1581680 RepID=A0A0B7J0D8_9PROT|nr:nickel ABC transporter permease [Candidatus Methylopumilus turicensis]CEN56108.1 putative peptide transporter permease subunit: membrane component of ABC superfamily [Candidatus Methylopumilus turicensis]